MSHGRTVCKLCETVLQQCRCMEHTDVTEVVCDKCEKIVDKAAGIKMHIKYKNMMFGVPMFDIPLSVVKAIDSDEVLDELFDWLDDKFWVCHLRGAEEEKKKHEKDIKV